LNVFGALNVRPVLLENVEAELFFLTLPDRGDSGAFESEVKAADPGKEARDPNLALASI